MSYGTETPASEALRQAMLEIIDSAKSDAEADLRRWAPFVMVGEEAAVVGVEQECAVIWNK
jgi:hypothetical protein